MLHDGSRMTFPTPILASGHIQDESVTHLTPWKVHPSVRIHLDERYGHPIDNTRTRPMCWNAIHVGSVRVLHDFFNGPPALLGFCGEILNPLGYVGRPFVRRASVDNPRAESYSKP
jgi:hypothetical protein